MSTTLDLKTTTSVGVVRPTSPPIPATRVLTNGSAPQQSSAPREQMPAVTPMSRVGAMGLLAVRLAIGFEFLWAFLDKTFGLR